MSNEADGLAVRSVAFVSRYRVQVLLGVALIGLFMWWIYNVQAVSHRPTYWVDQSTGTIVTPFCAASSAPDVCMAQQAASDAAEQAAADQAQVMSNIGLLILIVAVVLLVVVLVRSRKSASATSCTYCRERIRADAVVCKHCGRDVPRP